MKKIIMNTITAAFALGMSVSAVAVVSGKSDDSSVAPGTEVVIQPSEDPITNAEEVPKENIDTVISAEGIIDENNKSVRALQLAPDCNSVTKDDIFHMMLNTIDYFNEASGTMMFSCGDPDNVTVVQFQTNMPECESYSKIMNCSYENTVQSADESLSASDAIDFCRNGEEITVYPVKISESRNSSTGVTLKDAIPIKDEDRITTAPDGMPCISYRSNPTNVEFSSMCLFPQEITIGFLEDQDLWEIEGIKEFSGLDCYVIHGKTSEDYGTKLNVAEFEFLVDVNTGVLVCYEGFDANGNISDFMYTENLRFDDFAESVKNYSSEITKGYTES